MQATRNEGGGAKKKRSGVGWPYRNPRRYVTRECKSVFMNGAAVIPGGHEGRSWKTDWWRARIGTRDRR